MWEANLNNVNMRKPFTRKYKCIKQKNSFPIKVKEIGCTVGCNILSHNFIKFHVTTVQVSRMPLKVGSHENDILEC